MATGDRPTKKSAAKKSAAKKFVASKSGGAKKAAAKAPAKKTAAKKTFSAAKKFAGGAKKASAKRALPAGGFAAHQAEGGGGFAALPGRVGRVRLLRYDCPDSTCDFQMTFRAVPERTPKCPVHRRALRRAQ